MADVLHLAELRPAFTLSEHYPRMLTFEQPDGDSVSLPYGDLRYLRYDPAGAVRMRLADTTVIVHGRNLLPVWSALRTRRVRLLRAETESGERVRPASEPHISAIVVTEIARQA